MSLAHALMLMFDDIFTSNDREELMEAVLNHRSFPHAGGRFYIHKAIATRRLCVSVRPADAASGVREAEDEKRGQSQIRTVVMLRR